MKDAIDARYIRISDDGTSVCYCNLCRHSPDFGHCYFCPCGNNQPEPPLDAEALKIKQALEHARKLMRRSIEQKEDNPGSPRK